MTAGPLVLLVEDEVPLRRFLRTTLGAHGFRLVEASSVAEAELALGAQSPELILLDLGLPDGDGVDLTRRIREWSAVPILVLSARGREDHKVEALDAGADDYLTKPFGVEELLARLRVALRHASASRAPDAAVLELDGLRIDVARRRVTLRGAEVHLTPIEYRLLTTLAKHLGRVVTQQQLLTEVWGHAHAHHTHYLRVYMAALRRKIEDDPARPKLLRTEQGVGYRLRDPREG
ncbi:MAG: response regulator [Deltaproteobacteria bacterium]|nr:response regulator [Deltaproteobacteria bacterium]